MTSLKEVFHEDIQASPELLIDPDVLMHVKCMLFEGSVHLNDDWLGNGGNYQSIIIRAKRKDHQPDVAVKILNDYGREDKFLQSDYVHRFIRGGQINQSLQECPYVLPVYGFGFTHFWDTNLLTPYIAMKRADTDIHREARHHIFSHDQIRQLVSDIGIALDYTRDKGFHHLDLKPDNILWEKDPNTYFLNDFELAQEYGNNPVDNGLFNAFSAPELRQYQRGTDLRQADQYGLAMVAWYLLSRPQQPPHVLRVFEQSSFRGWETIDVFNSVSGMDDIKAVIRKGSATNPEDRYTGSIEFAEAICNVLI